MVETSVKVVWRYAATRLGALCAMTSGITVMLEWSVLNWDSPEQVWLKVECA